jgi:hypothetical protein
MQFLAYCSDCKERVTTTTKLDGSNLDRVLANDGDIEVVCFPRGHEWKLNAQDKANLRKLRA